MKVGYVRCSTVEQNEARQLKMMEEQGAEKLIFDVRFNPGGFASELVELLDYLLPEGELFRTVDYTGAEDVDKTYIEDVLPGKMRYNLKAIETFGFWGYIKTMFMTVFAVLGKEYKDPDSSGN